MFKNEKNDRLKSAIIVGNKKSENSNKTNNRTCNETKEQVSNNNDNIEENDDDIDINEMVKKFIYNMRQEKHYTVNKSDKQDIEYFLKNNKLDNFYIKNNNTDSSHIVKAELTNELQEFNKIENQEETIEKKEDTKSVSFNKSKQAKPGKFDDFFEQKILRDIMKTNQNKKKKYKSYHTRLLEKLVDSTPSRGKMVTFCDFNAYNSDDSSDFSEYESSLFYRYGLGSRFTESSPFKTQLPKWSSNESLVKSKFSKENISHNNESYNNKNNNNDSNLNDLNNENNNDLW